MGAHLPYPLRFLFAARPQVLSQVLGVVYRAISTYLIKKTGFTVASGARTGAVTLIQRFGSALNLNIHFHMLLLDRAYTFDGPQPSLHRTPRPTPAGTSPQIQRAHYLTPYRPLTAKRAFIRPIRRRF